MKAFMVVSAELRIFTVIGANNSMEAHSKANYLWGTNWDTIEPIGKVEFLYPEFVSIREFNKQIGKLQKQRKKETNS